MNDSRPVAIYNIEKKELIGIFSMTSLVIKYLFETPTKGNKSRVYNALSTKAKIKKTRFDFNVAIRYANDVQINMMSGEDYKIMDGYFVPHYTRMKGFTETKETLQIGWNERTNRRVRELKNKASIN